MGKRILYLALLTIVVIAAVMLVKKIKNQGVDDGGKETVFVSISPLKFIVDRVSGGEMNVEVLVPAGAGPETYEPTPLQLRDLDKAPVIFTVGLIDFEKALVGRVASASGVKVVPLSGGIDLLGGHCSHNHADNSGHHHHGGIDPHIWSSPRCLKTMSEGVYDALALLHPERAEKYRENLDLLLAEFDELDSYIASKIAASDKKYFLIYHPALTYYAADYGIEQIVVEDEGKEPSLDHMKSVVSRAKADNIKRIFYQREFSRSVVETLAADTGAEITEIDPLAEDVIANLRHITDLITE